MSKLSRRKFIQGAMALSTAPLALNAMDAKGKESLKFIHITDSHMDFADVASVEALELMVEFVNKNYPNLDFVLFGGDNYNNNVEDNKDAVLFKYIVDKLNAPYYIVRGNKESSPTTKLKSILSNDFDNIFLQDKNLLKSNKDWLIQKKGYLVLGLDSCVEHQNYGEYTQETLEFAESVLKKGKPTIILNHHPYTNYWKGTEAKDIQKYVLRDTKEAQKRLFKYPNLIMTLSGHKHIDSVIKINNTKVITTRGFIRPLDLDMYPMRFVEIKGDDILEKIIYTS